MNQSDMNKIAEAFSRNDMQAVGRIMAESNERSMRRLECSLNGYSNWDGPSSSPLWKAAAKGDYEYVKKFLKSSSIKKKKEIFLDEDSDWPTILHYMGDKAKPCTENHIKVGEILIAHGADLNHQDTSFGSANGSPVQYAINKGNLRWVEFLLAKGARLKGPEWDRYSAADCILRKGSVDQRAEMIKICLKHGLETVDKFGRNLLLGFIKFLDPDDSKAVEIVDILINAGIPVNGVDSNGWSPLLWSVQIQHIELIALLIRKGANLNLKSAQGEFPLYSAVHKDNASIVKLLISKGAYINAQNNEGWTALHHACSTHNEKMISLLILKGADFSVENNDGKTPFYMLKNDQCILAMVKEFSRLLYNGQSVNRKDMDLLKKNSKARKFLIKCNSEINRLGSNKFYLSYSYNDILKMSKNVRKVAILAKNEEFKEKFDEHLDGFTYYGKDLRMIFEEAIELRNESEAVFSLLKCIFGNVLADAVLNKLTEYLNVKDFLL